MIAALSQLSVPLPSGVPLTLQVFAVTLAGFALGGRTAAVSTAVYLLLGLTGLPVFAGFRGGPAVLFGPTGGFLIGFVPLALSCGQRSPWAAAAGLLACHALGVIQFAAVTGAGLAEAFALASLPYLLKDAALTLAAYCMGKVVRRRLAKGW